VYAGDARRLGLLLATLWPCQAAAQATSAEDPPLEPANLELSTALYSRAAADPARRTVLAHRLRLQAALGDQGGIAGGLGWVTLVERDRGDDWSTTSGPGNAFLDVWYRFSPPSTWRLSIELGVAIVINLSSEAEPDRTARLARTYALAMQAVWDSWLFADGRIGFSFPVRAARALPLGSRPGQLEVDGALVLMLPEQAGREDAFKKVIQLSAGYRWWPTAWLFAGAGLRTVWIPSAPLFRNQSSGRLLSGLSWGRWHLGGELVVNIDEPYGWRGQGERIWSATTHLGVSL
jgi:hypothetical protein